MPAMRVRGFRHPVYRMGSPRGSRQRAGPDLLLAQFTREMFQWRGYLDFEQMVSCRSIRQILFMQGREPGFTFNGLGGARSDVHAQHEGGTMAETRGDRLVRQDYARSRQPDLGCNECVQHGSAVSGA